ncbi:MAG: DUF3843 family protein [Bacteroidales bacterium]|nr:DUF3843 family protein [Bacteroidales bacterium]
MSFQEHRPPGFIGKGDQYLPNIIQKLQNLLLNMQESFHYSTLYLTNNRSEQIATILVEFAEDLYNDIGIWKSLEKYNREFFDNSLPLSQPQNADIDQKEINKYRIHHLLWVLFQEIDQELILAPHQKDLHLLTEHIPEFLDKEFSKIPRDSGIKHFLTTSNKYGWDVKRKLIWLGRHSYLFRTGFQNYIEKNSGKADISVIDDFICQDNTAWSGLGVIDILAALLNITHKQQKELRSWYERHFAYYKVVSINNPIMEVVNLINNKPYKIRVGDGCEQFKKGMVVIGSLIPWDKEWYWSGSQSLIDEIGEEDVQEMKNEFLQRVSNVAYRYCDQLAQKARDSVKNHYNNFVNFHGDDLITFPDGYSMAAAMQKLHRLQYESAPKDMVLEVMKKHDLKNPYPRYSYPESLLESDNGIGVFFNPDEGQEIMREFNDIINGFQKKGVNLTEDEKESIGGFIFSDVISPKFVYKLVDKYGDQSIAASFLIKNTNDRSYLEFLLRRYKGHFYRKRYPGISFK